MNILHSLAPTFTARRYLGTLAGHVWAAPPEAIEALFAELACGGQARGFGEADAAEARGYETRGRQARVSMRGVMFATGPKWLSRYGFAFSEHIIGALQAAQADSEVDEIVLEVDSPGGSVLGIEALSEAIGASTKPVTAYVLHMCASAALWSVARASRIVARPGADIGSIGTYCVIYDVSKAFEEQGVKAHVISTGFFKGAGTFGAPLTDAQRAEFQARVNSYTAKFTAALAEGRGLDAKAVADLATGQTWDAARALELGLVDEIEDMRGAAGAAPRASARASAAAQETTSMTKEEIEALRARAEAAEASNKELTGKVADLGSQLGTAKASAASSAAANEALRKTLEAQAANEKDAIIAEAAGSTGPLAGRISAVNREAIEAFAKTTDASGLRAFLGAMPVLTRPTATGTGAGGVGTGGAGGGARAPEPTGGDAALFSALGVEGKDLDVFADAVSIGFDGTLTLRDGTTRKVVN